MIISPIRFDREVDIPVPNEEARIAILRVHTKKLPLDGNIDLGILLRIYHRMMPSPL